MPSFALFPAALGGQQGIVALFLEAGPIAKLVFAILLFFSLMSWGIMFNKSRLFRRATPPPPQPEPEPEPEVPVEVPEDIPQLAPEEPPEEKPDPEPVREPDPEPAPSEPDEDSSLLPVDEDPLPAASKGEVDDTTVAGFDDPDFTYDYYSHQLIRAIGQAWRRPRIDKRLDLAIKFRIARNGTVSDVEVVRTSGIPSYDRAGIRALEDASPLPPLPVAYRKQSLGVTVLLP